MSIGRPIRRTVNKVAGVVTLAVLALATSWVAAQSPAAQAAPQIGQVSINSVWVPTPERMIHRMLQLADLTPQDLVIDLGSGDGRIPIYAARHFGARGVGVEIEENLVGLSVKAAAAQGVSGLVRFLRQDLFDADISQATVIALYISPAVMTRLKPRLLALKPGTRVVSHHFTLDDWAPDESVRTEDRDGYLWVVPADFRGGWALSIGEDRMKIQIAQAYQRLNARGEREGRQVPVIATRARGTQIHFTAFDTDGAARNYVGRIDGARMSGSSDIQGHGHRRWTAVRD